MNHSPASRQRLSEAAYASGVPAADLKAAARNQFGASIAELTDAQVEEFIATFPAMSRTEALHAITGLGVEGPGGNYKPDAMTPPVGCERCARCNRPGMWIAGAGETLCHAHQDDY